jgi:parallel beta-helix repeat protein
MRQSKLTAPLKTGQNFIMVKDPGRFRPGMEIFVHGRRDWGPQTEQVFSYRITEIQGHRFFLDKTAVFEQPVESAVCSGVPAIFVRKKKNVVIENLTVDGNARHNRAINVNNKMAGIYLWAVSDCSIRQCNICNCAGDGISIQFPPTGFKSSAPPQWDGPDNHGGSGIMILNNRIDACDNWGLHIGGGQSQTLIRGNIIRNCGYDGLFFCYDNTFTIISDNLIMHNRNNGIGGVGRGNGIDSDRENLIHNNICAYNGRCGIEIDGGSGNLIHGNICYGNSRRKPGRHPGIRVMSSAQETLVTNNLYRDTGNPTTQAE